MVELRDRSPGDFSLPHGVVRRAESEVSHEHLVRFYEDEPGLADAVVPFLRAGLDANDRVAVIATASHQQCFQLRLVAAGFDVERLQVDGTLTFLDAHETLSTFMRAGEPDPALFQASIGALIAKLAAREPPGKLRAYGEMVDVLWMDGQRSAALRLEELWNELQQQHPFSLLCAYSMASFYKEPGAIQQVCATHTHVVAESSSEHTRDEGRPTEPPSRYARQFIREIAHRSEVEAALRDSLRELRGKDEQLQDSEEQLRDFVENATLGLHQVGPDGTILWANRADFELLGYTRDEYIGRSIVDMHADRSVIEDILARLIRGEELHDYEARLRAKDGSVRYVLISSNVRSRDGQFINTRCFTRDITERKLFELENARLHQETLEARTHAEQLYRFAHFAASADKVEQVFEAGLDAIEGAFATNRAAVLLFDDDGVMRFRAWRRLSDDYRRAVEGHSPWSRDTVAPQPVVVEDVETDASLHEYIPLFRREGIGSLAFIPLVTRGRLLGKFMVYYGERHSYSSTEIELASAIGNHLASVTSRFAALSDLERTLHYSELFAGVLAHDLRNPLGAIVTAAQLVLMRQEGEGNRNAKPLSRIVSSGQRMARMIDQLLDFTRARVGGGIEIQARDTNLADLCSQAIGELELVYADRSIQCSVIGDQGGSWDPDRLLQIISNLVANASQHGRPGSEVVVRLDGQLPDSVVLEVHNQGAISGSLLPLLFDPFRGTRHRREQAQGLGLGLFIVKELVRAHGGTVDVQSTEQAGTTFTIRLPRRPPR